MSDFEMIWRLVLAAILGGLIGADREKAQRGAGLRTHAVVATASALFMIVSTYGFMQVISPGRIVLDPSRMAAQVVSGIGFLGAGIIIFRKNAVRGLTTAASIWAVGAIGLAVAAGLYVISIAATIILTLILTALKSLEKRFFPQRHITRITLQLNSSATRSVHEKLKMEGLKVISMNVRTNKEGNCTLKIEIIAAENLLVQVFNDLQSLSGVQSVSYVGRVIPMNDWASEGSSEEIAQEIAQEMVEEAADSD